MTYPTSSGQVATPAWVRDAVFYQIFPDRFARSARVAKPSNLQPWGAPPTEEKYQGGDLLGVVEKLDYLGDLGINAIYLNPIFQSASNHRYHTHDYYQVDPLLGGNEALRALVTAAHARGIRIVLDGVFNHASRGFFQFNDILEHGPHSPWLDWFTILGWPLAPYDGDRPANYVGWVGNRALPEFNTDNPQVREYLMQVGEYWLREFGVDGWRLDVPYEIKSPGFWEEFRDRVRAVNPEAYICAEIWGEAAEALQGDRFDATMNYEFAAAAIAFAAGERVSEALAGNRPYDPYPGTDAPTLDRRLRRLLALYDWNVVQSQLNLLDSHDAARVVSLARGDVTTLHLATLLQMTYPGAPCIYYGDEIALRGTDDYDAPHQDPDARYAFPWHAPERWDRESLALFQELIALRHREPALRRGSFLPLLAEGQLYVFARSHEGRSLIVAINAGDGPVRAELPTGTLLAEGQVPDPLFGPAAGAVTGGHLPLSLPPRSGMVLGG